MLQTTCPPVGPEHTLPHEPQLLRLDAVSTHWPLHDVGIAPPVHLHAPLTHCWPPEHAVPHAAQWFGTVCKLTHEPLQLVSPAPHVVWHVLVEQTWPLAHWFPQEPQLLTSDVVSTQALPHATPVWHPPSLNMPASFTAPPPLPLVTITPPLLPLLPPVPLLPLLSPAPLLLPPLEPPNGDGPS
jgi:hypothetical protein